MRALWCLLVVVATMGALVRGFVALFGTELSRALRTTAHPLGEPDRLVPALVTLASALGLLLVAAWLTASLLVCLGDALRGSRGARIEASDRDMRTVAGRTSLLRPRAVRLLVGVALGTSLGGSALPVHAMPAPDAPPQAKGSLAPDRVDWAGRLDGLRLPDRALGTLRRDPTASLQRQPGGPAPTTHRVRPGESLWLIAAARLGATAPASSVDAAWRRLYALNRSAIGPDPDLVLPGTVLQLPPHLSELRAARHRSHSPGPHSTVLRGSFSHTTGDPR